MKNLWPKGGRTISNMIAIVIVAIIITILAWVVLFPRNSFITFFRSDGSTITFSRLRVSLGPAPHRYQSNGLGHIDFYVSKLLAAPKGYEWVSIFTPDGKRGLSLQERNGKIEVTLTIDALKEKEREKQIRSFLAGIKATPSQDYLGANGGVSNSVRILSFRLEGKSEGTATIKQILQQLCQVSPTEPLNINFRKR